MINITRIGCNFAVVCSCTLALLAGPASAQQITAAQLFPKSTVLYSEITEPPKLLELVSPSAAIEIRPGARVQESYQVTRVS